MSLFLPRKKACLLMPSGPAIDLERKHLFILLCDPVTGQEVVLLATLSSVKEGHWYDDTCVLERGEHPFITKKSFIDYSMSRIVSSEKLENGVNDGTFIPKDPVDDTVLDRILSGLMESPRTPRNIQNFYTTYLI